LGAVDNGRHVILTFDYDAAVYGPETISRLARQFCCLAGQISSSPNVRVSELDVLTLDERQQLRAWNDTEWDFGQETIVPAMLESSMSASQSAVALEFGTRTITYAELNSLSDAIAESLMSRGAGAETVVGICAERSIEMVAALLGILKSGAAYLPLDPDLPADRLLYMIRQAGAISVLCAKQFLEKISGSNVPVLALEAALQASLGAPVQRRNCLRRGNLAYVIFTSGSTGLPKAAMNTHRGISNRLLWMQKEHPLSSDDVVLQKTPFGFDVSVWEFLWPLMAGARLVIADPHGHRDPVCLARLIQAKAVTTVHFVPSMLEQFLACPEAVKCQSLKRVICSGEQLPPGLVKRFFQLFRAELHNLYGPTEASVEVTAAQFYPEGNNKTVPIGRPIANTQIHILRPDFTAAPIGANGELFIGGIQVARGYANDPARTASRFVPDPFASRPGQVMYRSGDIARYGSDGAIEYVGRADGQVKIRGQRVELGEIENTLTLHPAIRHAAVLLDHKERLLAYIVPAASAPDRVSIRNHLRATLPEYMIPSHFVIADTLPVNANGKLDRKALLLASPAEAARDRDFVAPRTDLEAELARIWGQLLKEEMIGVTDNFFELGGHSLLAVQMNAQIREAFGVELSLRDLFDAPTIEELTVAIAARYLEQQPQEEAQQKLESVMMAESLEVGRGRGSLPSLDSFTRR
jgi:amino acid adenylation domain-containing protein